MKVALVFPGITDVGFRSYGDGIDGSWHSHGLCILSSCLKEAGHQVSLIDLRKLAGWEEYKKIILEIYPDVICITMMSCDFNPGLRCAELAHQVIPTAKVIVGGPHPSIAPEEVASHKDFDYIIRGEGEITLIELLSSLKEDRLIPRIIEGKHPDLDKLPYSDRELFGPFEVPISINGFEPPFMTFIAGRGCKYNCSFCQPAEKKIFGPKVRRRSPENFVGEIIKCHNRYNFKSYLIHDDCLIEDILWVERFCRLMEKNNVNIPFACQGRADLICKHPEILRKMKEVGLRAVIVGFESGNDRVLRFMRKGVRAEQNINAGKILKDLELKIWANYMFGVPTETLDEMLDTIKMIKQIKPDYCSPAIYTPHPGSDMFEYCTQNNLMLSLSHDSFRRNVTETKIKSQDWHVIEWAVSESVDSKSEIVPYSKDYFSHWGDLTNLANKEEWQKIESSCSEKLQFPTPSVQNLAYLKESTWRSITTDPQFVWEINPLLKSAKWRYLVVDLEVNYSTRAQFVWWTKDYTKYQATQHFRVKFGRNKYAFDLKTLKTYKNLIGNDLKWDDYEIQRLRLDPTESENVEITLHDFFLLGENKSMHEISSQKTLQHKLLFQISLVLSNIYCKLKIFFRYILFYSLIVLPFILLQLTLVILLVFYDILFVHQKENITNRPLVTEGNGYVAVIIPNYQGEPFLEKLLNSLMNQTYPLLNIYVVDNGSNDNSRKIVEQHSNVKWIDNGKNLGFSAAVNRGIKEAEGAEFYVLLNNDTLVELNWAEELVKEMRSDPGLGAVGSLIFLNGMRNTLNLYAHTLGEDLRSYNIGATAQYSPEIFPPNRYVLSASACSIMYRAIAFHDTGFFDDKYFLCYEDFDFNMRMFWKGWKTRISHSSRLFHISNASMETGSYTHVYYLCRNDLYPFIKIIPSSFMIKYFKNILFGHVSSAEIRLFFKWQGFKILLYRLALFENFLPLLRDRKQILSQRRIATNELTHFIKPISELSISKTYRLSEGETYLKNVHKINGSIKGVKVKLEMVNFSGINYLNELQNGKAKSENQDPQIYFNFPKRDSFPHDIYFELYCETVSWGQIIFSNIAGKEIKHILVSNHFRVHAGWNKYLFRIDSLFWNWEIALPDFFGLWKKLFNAVRIDPCEIGDVNIGLRNVFLIYKK